MHFFTLKSVWDRAIGSKSLQTQMVFGQLAITLTIIMGISFLGYHQLTNATTQNLRNYGQQVLSQLDEKVTLSLQHIDRLTIGVILNPDVKQLLENEMKGGRIGLDQKLKINNILFTSMYSADQPVSLRLFGLNGGVYDNIHSSFIPFESIDELKKSPFFGKVVDSNGTIIWLGSDAPELDGAVSSESAIIGVRRVNSEQDGKLIGFLLISLHKWALSRNIESVSNNDNGVTFLTDDRNRIIFSTPSVDVLQIQSALKPYLELNSGNGIETITVKGDSFWTLFRRSPYTSWNYVSAIPLKEIDGHLLSVQRFVMVVGLFLVGIAILYSILVSGMISNPIRQLVKGMQRVEKGDFTAQLFMKGNLEVNVLSWTFNRMVEQLRDLLFRLAEQQVREKEARLQAVDSQFRPHFLYNTLNTIYWKCVRNDQEEIGRMVITMSRLMRYSIQPGIDLVTVKRDFEQLNHYLYLQQMRYADDLEIEVELDSRIEACLIPKLLLQPVIENAMVHGLEPSLSKKRMVIRGEMEDLNIRLTVSDNGIGMNEEQLNALLSANSYADSHEGTGLGILNIQRRLWAHFEDRFTVDIESEPGKGTIVSICFPVTTEREGAAHVQDSRCR